MAQSKINPLDTKVIPLKKASNMKKTKYALVSAMLSFCLAAAISSTSSAKGKDPLEHTVNQLKGMIAEKPAVPEKLL